MTKSHNYDILSIIFSTFYVMNLNENYDSPKHYFLKWQKLPLIAYFTDLNGTNSYASINVEVLHRVTHSGWSCVFPVLNKVWEQSLTMANTPCFPIVSLFHHYSDGLNTRPLSLECMFWLVLN